MPELHKDLYAAACNPPRRAKRTNIPQLDPVTTTSSPLTTASPEFSSSTSPHQHRPILPMRPYAPRESAQGTITATAPGAPEPAVPPPPAKRGRKPGPLSRTAREAQRRLNHSIIEKARRTKINDALATLKQLVPPNYVSGQLKQQQKQQNSSSDGPAPKDEDEEEEDDDDDDDDEYDDGSSKKKQQQQKAKAKQNGKGTGKKEEKEKEFKLEILVRTVSFLQDVLEKVNNLEAVPSPTALPPPPAPIAVPPTPQLSCPNCGSEYARNNANDPEPSNWRKRKHVDTLGDLDDQPDERNLYDLSCDPEKPNASERQAKIPRRYSYGHRSGADEERAFDSVGDMDVDGNLPPSVSRNRVLVDQPHRAEAPRPHSHMSSSPTERLPPISSWLPNHNGHRNERIPPSPSTTPPSTTISNSMIDPQLLPVTHSSSELVKPSRSRTHSHSSAYIHAQSQPSPSYLPTPPGSTHFDPVRSSAGVPPLLSLGPVSTSGDSRPKSKGSMSPGSPPSTIGANVGSGGGGRSSYAGNGNPSSSLAASRTPEDESAASLLLQIASSPTFRPVPESSSTSSSPMFRGVSTGSGSGSSSGRGNGREHHDHQRDPSVLMLSSSDVRSEVGAGVTRREGGGGGYGPSSRVHEQQQQHEPQHHHRDRAPRQHQQQAQTPSSLLGLNLGLVNGRRY